jgi:hypothetical protein
MQRDELEEQLAQGVRRFENCAFDDEDLSRLTCKAVCLSAALSQRPRCLLQAGTFALAGYACRWCGL